METDDEIAWSEQNEPLHDKTNKMTCAPSKASDQTGRIVFAVYMKKPWALSYPLSTQQRLIRQSGCPVIWVLAGRMSLCWFCHAAAQIFMRQRNTKQLPFRTSLLSIRVTIGLQLICTLTMFKQYAWVIVIPYRLSITVCTILNTKNRLVSIPKIFTFQY